MVCFCDNDPKKQESKYHGYDVIRSGDILHFAPVLVLVSSTAYNVIKSQLIEQGVNGSDIYWFQPARLDVNPDGENQDRSFIRENLSKFSSVYAMLADEKSREIYRAILNYRITKDVAYLESALSLMDSEQDQYFDGEILTPQLMEDGGFVDVGAYTGDTVRSLFRHYPGYKGFCYCFEAAEFLQEELGKSIAELDNGKILPYKLAVWDGPATLKFDDSSYGSGGGSFVSDTGYDVEAAALDDILDGKPVSFIKMDIEGAERKALEGAERIIKGQLPVLAVCVYHRPEDLFDIPLLVESFAPGMYTYYIRQYRFGLSETVLYAVVR